MSNLYSDIDVFRLIDEEGVVLSVGGILEINEPEGFDDATISLERSEYHGVDFEFFDGESELGFDRVVKEGQTLSPYSLLQQIFAVNGTESKVRFQYLRTSTPDLIYDSSLIFSSRKVMDYKIVLTAERLDFNGDFKNRFRTDFDINSSENLNGGALTGLTYEDITLPPQNIRKNLIAKNDGLDVIIQSEFFDEQEYRPSFNEVVINTTGLELFSDSRTDTRDNLIFNEYGTYQIRIVVDFDFESTIDFDEVSFLMTLIYPKMRYATSDTSSATPADIIAPNIQVLGPGLANTRYKVQFDQTFTFNANKGDILRYEFFLDGAGAVASYAYVQENITEFTLVADVRSKYLLTKNVSVFDALNKHFEGITGESNVLTSTFIQAQETALLNGKLVRGFPETLPFRLNSKKAIDSLKSIYGLGVFVKADEIIIERYSYFYRDVEIAAFTEDIKDFEIAIDKDLIPNEIIIGYKTFADVEDSPLVVDSITDFLTQHQYLTSIRRDEKKTEFLSDWIASGYSITEGKELSFTLFPEEKWKEDENTFIVSKRDTNTLFSQTTHIFRLLDSSYNLTNQFKLIVENFIPFDTSLYTSLVIDGETYTVGFNGNPEGLTDPVVIDEEQNTTTFYLTDDLHLVSPYPPVTLNFPGQRFKIEDEDIQLNFTFKSVETKEPFDIIDNISFPFATYNARFNIKNMLFNNGPILNAGFNWQTSGKYRLLTFENNGDLRTQFAVGENTSTLDPNRLVVVQKDDINVSDVNNGDQLLVPEILTFEVRLGFSEIMAIREAHYNDSNPSYYGYISVTPYDGVTYKGFLKKMEYNPLTEMVKFTLIRKSE